MLSIGEAAAAVGVAVSALRYWDERGIVRPADRVLKGTFVACNELKGTFLASDVRKVPFSARRPQLGVAVQ
jgi:hypothetical protein